MSLTDTLASTLECPVCYDVPRSMPIFQCENGHLLCKDCRAKLKDCPICKTALRDRRNLTAEKVLEKLPVLCRFANHGCTLKFASEDRIEHEKICPVREVRCPFPLCKKKFCIQNLFDHDPEHRKDAMASREGFRITITFKEEETTEATNMYWTPGRCIFQEKEFYAVIVRDFKLKLWIIWVYLVGTREEARKYNFEVIVENGESSRLTFTSPVSGIDDGDEVILANGDVSCFPDLVTKRFWVQSPSHCTISLWFEIKASDVISDHENECPKLLTQNKIAPKRTNERITDEQEKPKNCRKDEKKSKKTKKNEEKRND